MTEPNSASPAGVRVVLSQTQIIRSLGEALAWLEKELDWGTPLAELRHLTGRIGELYAAMVTRGQMAPNVNQQGYDVVAPGNERVSVKTITSSTHVPFNPRTLDLVDRVIILRVGANDDEGVTIETLLDIKRDAFALELRQRADGVVDYPVRARRIAPASRSATGDDAIAAEARLDGWLIRQYESTTIKIWHNEEPVAVVMPELRKLAAQLGVDLRNGNGGQKNTRQLGANVIEAIKSLTA